MVCGVDGSSPRGDEAIGERKLLQDGVIKEVQEKSLYAKTNQFFPAFQVLPFDNQKPFTR